MIELLKEILPSFEDPNIGYVGFVLTIFGLVFFNVAWTYLMGVNLYQITIALFGVKRRREGPTLPPEKSFAIIVPAHNEDQVIAETVRSLRSVDYPEHLYEIFVVADNCSDETAVRAREAGATVMERYNEDKRGKPYAFEWAFEQIEMGGGSFDGIVTIDADNVVSANLLAEFNNRLLRGEQVIQGFLDTKNPNDNWITWSYAMAFWLAARTYQLARYQIGLPCALGGTGFCIATPVLRQYGWDVTSLTDDLEYTMRVLLHGVKPTWAHSAVIYDEKPLSMKASMRQRLRWMQGHWDVASRYFWPLLKRAITKRDLAAFDGAIYCISPTRTMLWSLTLIFAWVPFFFPEVTVGFLNVGIWLGVAVIGFYVIYPLFYLSLEKVELKYYVRHVLTMPFFALTWIPITWLGYFRRKRKHWDKTEHTRSLSIEEVEASKRAGLR
ncbi:MAG: glycosyltransferase [Dehalococcoidia bacterium]|nr:glycosyltransferase [Dehalococcoidia bacterium]